MLRPIGSTDISTLAGLALSLGGLWGRPAFSMTMPPPPFEQAIRSNVIVQALSCVPTNLATPRDELLGVCGLTDPDWRANTASLDVAIPVSQSSTTGIVTADRDVDSFQGDLAEFVEYHCRDWPFRRAQLRICTQVATLLPILESRRFELVAELSDAMLWRGTYFPARLYLVDLT